MILESSVKAEVIEVNSDLDALRVRVSYRLKDTFYVVGPSWVRVFLLVLPLPKEEESSATARLNLKACEVPVEGDNHTDTDTDTDEENSGRLPSNVLLVHSPTCSTDGVCARGCPIFRMDQMSGWLQSSGKMIERKSAGNTKTFRRKEVGTVWKRHDSGGYASRFYPRFRTMEEAMEWLETLTALPLASQVSR